MIAADGLRLTGDEGSFRLAVYFCLIDKINPD